MFRAPLKRPLPDFESLESVLKGEKQPQRVHFVELGVDSEVMKYIVENYMSRKWISFTPIDTYLGWDLPPGVTWQECQKECIDFYYRMGYDSFNVGPTWENLPKFKRRKAADTATPSRVMRSWVEEGGGIIKNWDDFERINWGAIKHNLQALDYTHKNLPDGMKITVAAIMFEMVLERFLGYEDLFILSHDEPKLVEAVFEEWGKKVYEYYKEAVQYPGVGAIWHVDDLGHKTGTMLSAEFLRKNVFPWFKRYAALAHEQGKTCWYHCCGNVLEVMDDLIEDIQFDAFHSFQDVIIPVGEFMERYGNRIGTLGGVDVDKIVRMSESELREYVRKILDDCMPGRYALGSGNSIANYVPARNYLIMLDEGLRWRA